MEHHLAKVGAAGSNPVSRFDIEKISKKLLTKRKRSGKISNVAAETQKQRSLRDTGSQGIIQTIRGRNQKKDEKST